MEVNKSVATMFQNNNRTKKQTRGETNKKTAKQTNKHQNKLRLQK